MSLNATPSADRIHIGIFGRRNAGKSSIINAITGQSLAIVSEIKGTTTDPVSKAMELLPLGPVVMIDTPGLDDEGTLGKMRVDKSYQILHKTDIAVLVVDGGECIRMLEESQNRSVIQKVNDNRMQDEIDQYLELQLLEQFRERKIPYVIAVNKAEQLSEEEKTRISSIFSEEKNLLFVSAEKKEQIYELKELIADQVKTDDMTGKIVGHLLQINDFVVLVVPIDSAAPKGRLILPQQQVIRDVLEAGAIPIGTRETELAATLDSLGKKPALVITDSQAFAKVSVDTPGDIPLTSFSILFARYKGELQRQIDGASALKNLQDGDIVLISEGCTHHRQCDDIGTVKMPRWIREYTGKEIKFEFSSGIEFPEDLSKYKVIVHCGGCTLNEREMKHRIQSAINQSIPITNYGVAIAYMQGILPRTVEMFEDVQVS